MPRLSLSANRAAFLDMLADSELGQDLLDVSDDGYNVLVGSTPHHPLLFPKLADGIPDYSTHPHILNAALNSTAAGRYQLLARYFAPYQKLLGLPDFSPQSQDAIAIQMITEAHALPSIDAGDLADAVRLCAHLWASLPGAGYGQHEQKSAMLIGAFLAAGGTLAGEPQPGAPDVGVLT